MLICNTKHSTCAFESLMNETVQQRAAVVAERRTAIAVYFELVRTCRLSTQKHTQTSSANVYHSDVNNAL